MAVGSGSGAAAVRNLEHIAVLGPNARSLDAFVRRATGAHVLARDS